MKITIEWLTTKGACKEQRKVFTRLFPNGTNVTLRSLAKARKAGMPVAWLDDHIPADKLDGYRKVWLVASSEYLTIPRAVFADHGKVRDVARCEFEKVVDVALVEAFKD